LQASRCALSYLVPAGRDLFSNSLTFIRPIVSVFRRQLFLLFSHFFFFPVPPFFTRVAKFGDGRGVFFFLFFPLRTFFASPPYRLFTLFFIPPASNPRCFLLRSLVSGFRHSCSLVLPLCCFSVSFSLLLPASRFLVRSEPLPLRVCSVWAFSVHGFPDCYFSSPFSFSLLFFWLPLCPGSP